MSELRQPPPPPMTAYHAPAHQQAFQPRPNNAYPHQHLPHARPNVFPDHTWAPQPPPSAWVEPPRPTIPHERRQSYSQSPERYYARPTPHPIGVAEPGIGIPEHLDPGLGRAGEQHRDLRRRQYLAEEAMLGQRMDDEPPCYYAHNDHVPDARALQVADNGLEYRRAVDESLSDRSKDQYVKVRVVEEDEKTTRFERAATAAMKDFMKSYERKQVLEREARRCTGMYLLRDSSDGSILVKKKRR